MQVNIRIPVTMLFMLMVSTAFSQNARKGSMKKPFILSQQFKHSMGIGASFYPDGNENAMIYQLAYSPSLSLTRSFTDMSISVGSQLSAGYHISAAKDDTAFIYADLPLLFEMNFGHNASKDFYSDLGWFFGGGYSYHLFKETWNHGPVATIGARAFLFGPSFTVRYSRYFAVQKNDESLHTITLLLNLGRYFEQVKLNNKVSRFSK